jgi:cytochrome c553
MIYIPKLWLAAGLLALSIGRTEAVDAGHGAELAASCAACHRLEGGETRGPSITGIEPEKLIAMMQAFKASERPNYIMHVVSRSFSDDEINAIAQTLSGWTKETKLP